VIVLYTGVRGCGKTTTLVKDALGFHRAGWTVITNMRSLAFADEVLSEDDILGLLLTDRTDFVIVIDEIQTFIDSRRSMKQKNVSFAYFIQQIRKRNVIILAATQFASRVDIVFKEHTDIQAFPRYFREYGVVVVRYVDLTRLAMGQYADGEPYVDVVYDPAAVFRLFDTREVITPAQSS
jgi:predicted AAA+ superfamily ATPase